MSITRFAGARSPHKEITKLTHAHDDPQAAKREAAGWRNVTDPFQILIPRPETEREAVCRELSKSEKTALPGWRIVSEDTIQRTLKLIEGSEK